MSLGWPSCFQYLRQFKEKPRTDEKLRGYTIAIMSLAVFIGYTIAIMSLAVSITAHAPGPRARLQDLQNNGSWMFNESSYPANLNPFVACSFRAAWEDKHVRVPLVALYCGNIMAKQPTCSRLYMSLLLVSGENRMTEVGPNDDIWGFKLPVAPEHKDIHGNIGWLLYEAKELCELSWTLPKEHVKLQEESYKLLAAIVKDKAGAEKMPEAVHKELDGLRADMLERGVPAEYLDFEVPEGLAEAVRELTPELAAQAIKHIH